MAKPGPKRASQQRRSPSESRDRIIESAAGALREEGFAGASARSIAARGGFNSALIFYYFDSINALFLAALERSSSAQLTRYQSATAEASDIVRALGDHVVAVEGRR
jgi:AcrR family transcriptional regulator